MRTNARLSSHLQRAFTLVEMLVTLMLMAMISALLWQAMHQAMRVEQLLQRSGVDGQLTVVRREWLRGLIESSLVEQIGAPRQLQGDGRQFTIVSADAMSLPGLQSTALQVVFETDARSGRQRLLIGQAPAGSLLNQRAQVAPVELLTWVGRPGAVRFLNASGQWLDQWPPAPSLAAATGSTDTDMLRASMAGLPRLPLAIFLDLGSDLGGGLVAAVGVTEPGRVRLFDWERQ